MVNLESGILKLETWSNLEMAFRQIGNNMLEFWKVWKAINSIRWTINAAGKWLDILND